MILYGRTPDKQFTYQGPLASGGFSDVHEVVDNEGHHFAVKTVKSGYQAEISSIRHEGNLLSRIQGDNIIRLIYFHDGTVYNSLPPYLILEQADGNLLQKIRTSRNHFTMAELLDMFLQICRGMRLVNETVVHGDLNPSNILLIGNTLKIADFGVAEPIGQPSNEAEFREHRHWKYVAPEYWENGNSTAAMDIYCAGLVFYYAATLTYPYGDSEEGDDESACKEAHAFQVAKPPCELNDKISSDLSHLILRMLAKKPEDRFHSWDAVVTILRQCADSKHQPPYQGKTGSYGAR